MLTAYPGDNVDAYNHQDSFDRPRKDTEIELTYQDDDDKLSARHSSPDKAITGMILLPSGEIEVGQGCNLGCHSPP